MKMQGKLSFFKVVFDEFSKLTSNFFPGNVQSSGYATIKPYVIYPLNPCPYDRTNNHLTFRGREGGEQY